MTYLLTYDEIHSAFNDGNNARKLYVQLARNYNLDEIIAETDIVTRTVLYSIRKLLLELAYSSITDYEFQDAFSSNVENAIMSAQYATNAEIRRARKGTKKYDELRARQDRYVNLRLIAHNVGETVNAIMEQSHYWQD